MLSISTALKGIGKGNYYLNQTQEDYYLDGGEPIGRWAGFGARILGLEEEVKREEFMNVLGGFTPDGKVALTQNSGQETRRSAWDLTFNAPKSVSVLWSQASPEVRQAIQVSHDIAVRMALAELETVAGVTRRGKGGSIRESTPFTVALFDHGTSRAMEPHLHTHALLMNLAFREDGSTGSLETRSVFIEKMGTGENYRRHFANELQDTFGLQVEWKGTLFELTAVPSGICERFSTRRKEIQAALAERGLQSPQAARIAALDTRSRKEDVPREKLFVAWRDIGRVFGFGPEEAERVTSGWKRERQPDQARHFRTEERSNTEQTAGANSKEEKGQQSAKGKAQSDRSTQSSKRSDEPEPNGPFGAGIYRKRPRPPHVHHWLIYWANRFAGVEFRIQQKFLVPKAPKWSPLSKLSSPVIRAGIPRKDEIIFKKNLIALELQVRKKHLFPNAPTWSPASELTVPAIHLKPKAWGKEILKLMTETNKRSEEAEKRRREEERLREQSKPREGPTQSR